MWDFFNSIWQALKSGGLESVLTIETLIIIVLVAVVSRLWKSNRDLTKMVNSNSHFSAEEVNKSQEFLIKLLDRYHEDKQMTTKALTDIKVSLAKISGRLF